MYVCSIEAETGLQPCPFCSCLLFVKIETKLEGRFVLLIDSQEQLLPLSALILLLSMDFSITESINISD